MTTETIPKNSTYTVRPWAERYQQTQRQRHGNFDGYPCAICGKDVKQDRVKYGGIVTTEGEWTLDPDHPRSQGWHVVGADCHRRFVVREAAR